MFKSGFLLFLALVLFVFIFFLPILIGLLITFLTSFGFDVSEEGFGISLSAWKDFFIQTQSLPAFYLTFKTSTISTILSIGATFFIGAYFYNSKLSAKLEKNILPFLLSIPHSTFAIGLVFLIAPSGFFFRVLNLFFNWESPPQVVTYQDQGGWALIASLCIREIPFLLFVMIGALSQIKTELLALTSKSMGYSNFKIWTKVIWPQIYPRLKLPIFVVLAYSLAPIDMSIIIGPNNPPTLIILILDWFREPDLYYKEIASCAAITIFFLLVAQLFIWRGIERVFSYYFTAIKINGVRGKENWFLNFATIALMIGVFIPMFLSFLLNLVWSFSKRWPFPEIIPKNLSWQYWEGMLILDSTNYIFNSLLIGICATLMGISLGVLFLEVEKKFAFLKRIFSYSIYFPLLIPNIIFLFGIYLFYLYFDLNFIYLKIILVHLLFVVPYVFITLRENYRRYDQRYSIVGKSLGKNSLVVFLKIKLFILIKPLLFALAIGFSVSFAEYLSTLWIGEGRVVTITTEAVNLAGGGDRNIIGVFAFLQIVIPLAFFSFCIFLNKKLGFKL